MKKMKIAVVGTDYIGLSIGTLLAQYHEVTVGDIIGEKVNLIKNKEFFIFQTILSTPIPLLMVSLNHQKAALPRTGLPSLLGQAH